MKKALLLIDLQNDYFNNGAMPLENATKACENAKSILDRFREESLHVIHIQHISNRPDATFFLPHSEGVKIHKTVSPLPNEMVFKKHYPNSFRETGLLKYLTKEKIQELVICGMMTHMCVDATVRAAKDFGYTITLIGDACATKNLEYNSQLINARDVHFSFLAALSYFYSTVQTSKAFLE